MSCKDIFLKINEYLDMELSPANCGEIENHIKDCAPCVTFINTLKKTVRLLQDSALAADKIPQTVSRSLKKFLEENIDSM